MSVPACVKERGRSGDAEDARRAAGAGRSASRRPPPTSSAREPCSSASTSTRRTCRGRRDRARSSRSPLEHLAALGRPSRRGGRLHAATRPRLRPRRRADKRAPRAPARSGTAPRRTARAPSGRATHRARGPRRRAAAARADPQRGAREPRRGGISLTARLRRGDRQQRRHAKRTEVEPFEDDRTGGDGACGRETERGDRVGELRGGVRRIDLVGSSSRASSSTSSRSVSRPNSGGSNPWPRARVARSRRRRSGAADPASEVGVVRGRQPDDRRERDVGARAAEERLLEIRVGRVERLVVPVETTAALGRPRQHRHEIERKSASSSVSEARVRSREDRGGRLALAVVDRVPGVGKAPQRRRLLLDEAADERPVLVERRAVTRRVLLERERNLSPALRRERGEAEAAQRLVQVRCPESHTRELRAARVCSSLAAPGTSTSSGCRRPGRRSGSRCGSVGTAGRPGVDRAAGSPPSTDARIIVAAVSSARSPRFLRHVGEPQPRRQLRRPQRFREPHVPDPGDELWSSSDSPNQRVASARAVARASRRFAAAARGCPAEARERRVCNSSTGPFQSTASALAPRSTSHGVPRAVCPRGRTSSGPTCAGASARRCRPRTAARCSSRAPRPTRACVRRSARATRSPAPADAASSPRSARRPAPAAGGGPVDGVALGHGTRHGNGRLAR